jgi:predicted nucleic acid-binding protein
MIHRHTLIYLDTNVYNRPFDDQTQLRISLETLAFISILQMIETNQITLVTSTVLVLENDYNPFPVRQQWVNYCLNYTKHHQTVNDNIRHRAKQLESKALKSRDALHLACAEVAACDYFLTCDDLLIKRYKGTLQVNSPVDFVLELTRNNDES